MADTKERLERGMDGERSALEERAPEDSRRPYEAPRLLKKRSVARATLFTAMGAMASGLTVMG